MKKSPAKQRFLAAALAGASLLGAGANASAAGVSVTALSDVFGLFNAQPFDTTTNTLAFLPQTPPGGFPGATVFEAASLAGLGSLGSLGVIYDTVSVTFKADPGMKITTLGFFEKGGYVRQGGSAATYAGGSIVVNAGTPTTFVPVPVGTNDQGTAGVTDWDVGLTNPVGFVVNGDTATVVVTNILAAITAPGSQDVALIWKNLAALRVEVAPVPLPPALWMLGSALVGLVTVGRRKTEG
jgi:hypothetical protein